MNKDSVNALLKIYKMALEIEKHNAKEMQRPIDQDNIEEHAQEILRFLKQNSDTLNLFNWQEQEGAKWPT